MQDVLKNFLPECKLGTVAHTCNPKTAEVETGVSGIQDQPQLHEILSQWNKKSVNFFKSKNHKTKSSQLIIDSAADQMLLSSFTHSILTHIDKNWHFSNILKKLLFNEN